MLQTLNHSKHQPFNYQGPYKIYRCLIFQDGMGRTIVFGDKIYKFRLPNDISNKSEDIIAIQQAFKIVWYGSNENYIVLADSKDAITSIKNVYSSDGIVLDWKITRQVKQLLFRESHHVLDIADNELVDETAKNAFTLSLTREA